MAMRRNFGFALIAVGAQANVIYDPGNNTNYGLLEAWGKLGPRYPNASLPTGSSISCAGKVHFSNEVSLGFPVGDRCALVVHHLQDFPGGCSTNDIYSPAHREDRKRVGQLGAEDVENDLQILILDPPRRVPLFFDSEVRCVAETIPTRVRKNGATTYDTDVPVVGGHRALDLKYGKTRSYRLAEAWWVNAPGLATPDDSGAFVEGLVKVDGVEKWCALGMLVGGTIDHDTVAILPFRTMEAFAAAHHETCSRIDL